MQPAPVGTRVRILRGGIYHMALATIIEPCSRRGTKDAPTVAVDGNTKRHLHYGKCSCPFNAYMLGSWDDIEPLKDTKEAAWEDFADQWESGGEPSRAQFEAEWEAQCRQQKASGPAMTSSNG